jgi:rRNA-processing protein FCF1
MAMKSEPARKTIRVILDSNALFVPIQLKIDIFQELKTLLNRSFELVLLKPIQQELEELAREGSLQTRKKALYALMLAEKCKIVDVEESAASPDDIIFQTASRWRSPVFTNDSELRKKLRNINVPVIYVRQKSRLEIDGRL